jgi:protein TonB
VPFIRANRIGLVIAQNPASSFLDASVGVEAGRAVLLEPACHKERSVNISVLFLMLVTVTLLHLAGVSCFLCPDLPEAKAVPIKMEVSTITIPATKPSLERTQPPPPSVAQPKPKKPQLKPRLKKVTPQAPPSDFSMQEQIFDQQPRLIDDATQPSIPEKVTADNPSPAYTEAYLNAAYQHNPKPEYPSIARSRGWQGKVTLRVEVSEEGQVVGVAVEQSCGHESLDESAVEAVKQWRFVPAKRAEINVASAVLVPIIFTLQDQAPAI